MIALSQKYQAALVRSLIGLPWSPLGRGPESFDCYGLLRYIYAQFLDIDLPDEPVDPRALERVSRGIAEAEHSGQWDRLESPQHLAAVALSRSRRFHHIGVWLEWDGGYILHAAERQNVVAQTLPSMRASGWSRIEFYRYAR